MNDPTRNRRGAWLAYGRPVAAALALLVTLSGNTGIQAPPVARASTTVGRASAAQAPELSVVSEDPYTNPRTYHRTEVEPDSFAFGSTIVATFQAGRSYRCGASNLGLAVSTDVGATWMDGFLPGTTVHAIPSGPWLRASDPVVAYNAKYEVWLVQGLGIRSCPFAGGDIFVSRSADGAKTFDEPVIIQRQKREQLFDKPWIGCDNNPSSPFYGHCYSQWDDEAHHLRLNVSTSTDGGLTWQPAVIRRDTRVIGGQFVIQPDGTAILVTPQCCTRIDTFISRDGGASFEGHGTNYSGPLAIYDLKASPIRGRFRHIVEPPFLSVDIDGAGDIYVVWPDCRFRTRGPGDCTQNDIVMSTSSDGRHWSDVVRIPIDARSSSVDHFTPAIAVDPTTSGASAHIAVVYYFYPNAECTVATCELNVGFVSSTDGGATWASQQLAGPFRTSWFPLTPSGYMAADYVGMSFVDGNAIPVFPVATEGACELGDPMSCNVWTVSATIPLVPAP
jgi:hypothetical protein